jgi:hypothetical protein
VIEQITYLLFVKRIDDLHTLEDSYKKVDAPDAARRLDGHCADASISRYRSASSGRPHAS